MDPSVLLTGLSKYLANQPADEVLRRTVRYLKAVADEVPRIVFRERHEDAYPAEFLIIRLGPEDSREVRIDYLGYFIELK